MEVGKGGQRKGSWVIRRGRGYVGRQRREQNYKNDSKVLSQSLFCVMQRKQRSVNELSCLALRDEEHEQLDRTQVIDIWRTYAFYRETKDVLHVSGELGEENTNAPAVPNARHQYSPDRQTGEYVAPRYRLTLSVAVSFRPSAAAAK